MAGAAEFSKLGAALRRARERAGRTLRETADGAGISYSTLSRIERGLGAPPSVEVIQTLARRVGLGDQQVQKLAGSLVPQGFAELAAPDIRRSVKAGHLSPGALNVLRREHLGELAAEFSASLGDSRPVDIRAAAVHASLALARGRIGPGFDCDGGAYLIPPRADLITERAWTAHGVAHRLIAHDKGCASQCAATARSSSAEREATYLASHLLVPKALLAAELRRQPLPPQSDTSTFVASLERVASRFRAPVSWAVARIAEEKIGELPW